LSSVRLLVSQYGANVNMTCGLSPQIAPHLSDLLPLSAVALSLDEDKESGYLLAKELLALGADPSAITNGYPRPLVNAIDANNVSQCKIACHRCVLFCFDSSSFVFMQTGVARAILEAGVPASSGDEDRLCSIVRAAARNAPSMIRLFLKHGVSVEGTIKNSSYGTPLIQSLISGPDCFELLLEVGNFGVLVVCVG
jgi:ankyrin repeat protein